ncbi:conserved exported hypothetical protein [Bosea sp. 62]|uniref:hypothetical protein n=1 Tax=unclassified Bosea (in: a-proteobacteria) TaxID=2653178 RepID=UPI0012530806|nr:MULTISPECIES: hypothetical protein [unclassified Bosea (in: a-proteobacteria)]CAD5258171.1 conserved exported hypothetical protein [Bosea sp. 46]CAD5262603.1 conserved exported hypothetical protein [Bosea sp. 21B]CAD5277820.1 conserved exported hypothetical protein [Bosea sp. 7B]VVT58773.1 conserved exported hypothetical protein [Bosea sp. EC-HK365B]VXB60301.1 conserved exported hypothetical protein [Bosea sp. 29B]
MSAFGKSRFLVTLAVTGSVLAAGLTPVMAGETRPVGFDKSRLDAAQVDYSQYYRRGWRGGNRGAAIAAGVGLGLLGAAAIAASRPAYAEPVYGYDDGYYDEPVYVAPRRYYAPRYYYPDNIRDPAGGSYR